MYCIVGTTDVGRTVVELLTTEFCVDKRALSVREHLTVSADTIDKDSPQHHSSLESLVNFDVHPVQNFFKCAVRIKKTEGNEGPLKTLLEMINTQQLIQSPVCEPYYSYQMVFV